MNPKKEIVLEPVGKFSVVVSVDQFIYLSKVCSDFSHMTVETGNACNEGESCAVVPLTATLISCV
jgi:hypothetical protein